MNVLSVDLGTSNSVAALSAHGRPPRVIDVDGASTMPSAVFAEENGRLVVGREAVRRARLAPARFEPNPKRRVDDGSLLLGDTVVPVTAALAAVLGKITAEAVRQLGGAWPDEVRLTHPAGWGAPRRDLLLAAAGQAGLGEVRLVPEPVAAAAHFAAVTGRVAPLAVYDLGAGTFDAAVVGGFAVLAEAGLPDLGGLDVDQALLEHVGRQVSARDGDGWQRLLRPQSKADRRAARALREDVRAAKEALSEHPQTEIPLPDPFGDTLVARTELEELIRPGLLRSVELLAATIRGAGVPVTDVYLVGGSSRIPLVATLIAEQLRVVPAHLDQPETAVALGAHQVHEGGVVGETRTVAITPPPPAAGSASATRPPGPAGRTPAPFPVAPGTAFGPAAPTPAGPAVPGPAVPNPAGPAATGPRASAQLVRTPVAAASPGPAARGPSLPPFPWSPPVDGALPRLPSFGEQPPPWAPPRPPRPAPPSPTLGAVLLLAAAGLFALPVFLPGYLEVFGSPVLATAAALGALRLFGRRPDVNTTGFLVLGGYWFAFGLAFTIVVLVDRGRLDGGVIVLGLGLAVLVVGLVTLGTRRS